MSTTIKLIFNHLCSVIAFMDHAKQPLVDVEKHTQNILGDGTSITLGLVSRKVTEEHSWRNNNPASCLLLRFALSWVPRRLLCMRKTERPPDFLDWIIDDVLVVVVDDSRRCCVWLSLVSLLQHPVACTHLSRSSQEMTLTPTIKRLPTTTTTAITTKPMTSLLPSLSDSASNHERST